jgi:hypothetical protein
MAKICGYQIEPDKLVEGQQWERARIHVEIEELSPGGDGGWLEVSVTHEGLIIDIIDLLGEVVGTRAETFSDMIAEMLEVPF